MFFLCFKKNDFIIFLPEGEGCFHVWSPAGLSEVPPRGSENHHGAPPPIHSLFPDSERRRLETPPVKCHPEIVTKFTSWKGQIFFPAFPA